jgi:hypothetical protein
MSHADRSARQRPAYTPIGGVLAPLVLAAILSACSSASLQGSWKDPQFAAGPLRNVLVIGVARNPATRRIFEDSFADRLRAQGTPATASHPLLPDEGAIPKERIRQAVAQSGADSVLVTRVLRVQRAVLVTPGRGAPDYVRDDFKGWYAQTWTSSPPPVEEYDVLTIESTLWDMRQERVVWKGTSETTARANVASVTGELANLLIAQMKADRVI